MSNTTKVNDPLRIVMDAARAFHGQEGIGAPSHVPMSLAEIWLDTNHEGNYGILGQIPGGPIKSFGAAAHPNEEYTRHTPGVTAGQLNTAIMDEFATATYAGSMKDPRSGDPLNVMQLGLSGRLVSGRVKDMDLVAERLEKSGHSAPQWRAFGG